MRLLRPALALLGLWTAPANLAIADGASPSAREATSSHRHPEAAHDPDSGVELLGARAPDWSFTRWIGRPLTLGELRGKVVLIRWWTEGCRFCAATLPELETMRRQHAAQGLVVVGVYHPKPPREVSNRHVVAKAKQLGFAGPLAVDRDWTMLDRYWLAGHPERDWTSVSFLIDRRGLIRWVHGGGEYHHSTDPAHARCVTQFEGLEQVLSTVLAEPAESPSP